jgi:hypothetical protein
MFLSSKCMSTQISDIFWTDAYDEKTTQMNWACVCWGDNFWIILWPYTHKSFKELCHRLKFRLQWIKMKYKVHTTQLKDNYKWTTIGLHVVCSYFEVKVYVVCVKIEWLFCHYSPSPVTLSSLIYKTRSQPWLNH